MSCSYKCTYSYCFSFTLPGCYPDISDYHVHFTLKVLHKSNPSKTVGCEFTCNLNLRVFEILPYYKFCFDYTSIYYQLRLSNTCPTLYSHIILVSDFQSACTTLLCFSVSVLYVLSCQMKLYSALEFVRKNLQMFYSCVTRV